MKQLRKIVLSLFLTLGLLNMPMGDFVASVKDDQTVNLKLVTARSYNPHPISSATTFYAYLIRYMHKIMMHWQGSLSKPDPYPIGINQYGVFPFRPEEVFDGLKIALKEMEPENWEFVFGEAIRHYFFLNLALPPQKASGVNPVSLSFRKQMIDQEVRAYAQKEGIQLIRLASDPSNT